MAVSGGAAVDISADASATGADFTLSSVSGLTEDNTYTITWTPSYSSSSYTLAADTTLTYDLEYCLAAAGTETTNSNSYTATYAAGDCTNGYTSITITAPV